MRGDVLPGRMFSFERYYAEDRAAYYAALRSVRERTSNMEFWLEYFLRGLVEEYERVASTVAELISLLSGGGSAPLRLSASQQRALTTLRLQGLREFTRRDYEAAARVSRSGAGNDLRELAKHRVVLVRDTGSRTRYAFPGTLETRKRAPGAGRPAKWTDSKIEAELREFLADKTTWPRWSEFRAAGKGALYSAATRAGGIGRWRQIIGM